MPRLVAKQRPAPTERAFTLYALSRLDLASLEELVGLSEVALGILHELTHRFFAAETIGLALELRTD
jgi:hypothetical protein